MTAKYVGVKSIAKNAMLLSAARLFTLIMRGCYIIVLARYLGPELYGIFSYGQALYLVFLFVASLGIGEILSREIGRNRENAIALLDSTLLVRILSVVISASIFVLSSWLLESDARIVNIVAIFAIALIGRGFAMWSEHVFVSFESTGYSLRQEVVFRPLELAGGISAVFMGANVETIVAIHALVWWLQAGNGFLLVNKHFVTVRLRWSIREIKRLLVDGIPIGLHRLLSVWLLQAPVVVYRLVHGANDHLGQLALVMQVIFILVVIPGALANAALPILSRTVVRQDGKDRLFAYGLFKLSTLTGAIVALGGMHLGSWAIELVFGVKFAEAGQLLGHALWGVIPMAWGSIAYTVLLARGQIVLPTVGSAVSAAVITVMVFTLADYKEPLGAIVGAIVGFTVWGFAMVAIMAKFCLGELYRILFWPVSGICAALATYVFFLSTNAWLGLFLSCLLLLFVSALDGRFNFIRWPSSSAAEPLKPIPRSHDS